MKEFEINQLELLEARERLARFKLPKSDEQIFYNLCFCLCVPQAKYTSILTVVKRLSDNNFFQTAIDLETLKDLIKESRFKNKKAVYLLEAKEKFNSLLRILKSNLSPQEKRYWIVTSIKGMGLKAAGHFLRNMGEQDLAIIDTHIKKFLEIEDKKWNYYDVENQLRNIAASYGLNITLAELDAMIWKQYSKTPWLIFIY